METEQISEGQVTMDSPIDIVEVPQMSIDASTRPSTIYSGVSEQTWDQPSTIYSESEQIWLENSSPSSALPPSPNMSIEPQLVSRAYSVYNNVLVELPTTTKTQWNTELCNCMADPTIAVATIFCPCCIFGEIAAAIDTDADNPDLCHCGVCSILYFGFCLIGLPCMLSCIYRHKLRNKQKLEMSSGPDWFVHCCCECCALCQEYRQLHPQTKPGGDQGNLSMQQVQGFMVPPTNQNMRIQGR